MILSLFLLVLFDTNVKQAYAYYACSKNEARCADASFLYGGSKTTSTSSIYFSKGEKIEIQWENDSPGREHVAFYIMSDKDKISKTIYAPAYGNNRHVEDAPFSGYYYMVALCKGGETNTCKGGGRISIE